MPGVSGGAAGGERGSAGAAPCPRSGGSAAGPAARGAQGAACAGRERGRRAGTCHGLRRVRAARGGRRDSPCEGTAGPGGGGKVRALCGNACGAPAPAARGEAAGERRAPPALLRGVVPGALPPTAALRAGSRGRALSPTAPRGGQRCPQPAQRGGGAGWAGPRSGPAPWQGRRARNAIGVLRCPPSVPRQGRRALTAPHRADRPAARLPLPARCTQVPVLKPTGGCRYRGQRDRQRCRSGGCAAPKGRPPWGHCGAPPGQRPPRESERRLRAGSAASRASAPPATAPPPRARNLSRLQSAVRVFRRQTQG